MTFFVEVLSKNLDPQTPVRRIGEYSTKAEAITAAHRLIEDCLNQEFKPGMDSDALFARYQERREYPFIFRDDDHTFNVPGFSHILYAITCATEICGGKT
jgi:hypothetical protein